VAQRQREVARLIGEGRPVVSGHRRFEVLTYLLEEPLGLCEIAIRSYLVAHAVTGQRAPVERASLIDVVASATQCRECHAK
jgi:hypothetical protein